MTTGKKIASLLLFISSYLILKKITVDYPTQSVIRNPVPDPRRFKLLGEDTYQAQLNMQTKFKEKSRG